jgi:DNA-binding transcriptional regulator GbsR (MarR family)
MEQQTRIPFFPIFSGGTFYPETLSRILSAFYVSNQKQLTIREIRNKTNLSNKEILTGLQFLSGLGEVTNMSKDKLSSDYFSFNVPGNIENLKENIKKSKDLITVIEQILDRRDSSNQKLNTFIKDTIVFYSEVLDFMDIKIKEHFKLTNF